MPKQERLAIKNRSQLKEERGGLSLTQEQEGLYGSLIETAVAQGIPPKRAIKSALRSVSPNGSVLTKAEEQTNL